MKATQLTDTEWQLLCSLIYPLSVISTNHYELCISQGPPLVPLKACPIPEWYAVISAAVYLLPLVCVPNLHKLWHSLAHTASAPPAEGEPTDHLLLYRALVSSASLAEIMNLTQSKNANHLSRYQWHPESPSEAVCELWMRKELLLTFLKVLPVAESTRASVRLGVAA